MSRLPAPPLFGKADALAMSPTALPLRPTISFRDRGIERLTRDCLAMTAAEATARIDREVAAAIESSRWDDAIKWQRVKLRVRKMQSRAAG